MFNEFMAIQASEERRQELLKEAEDYRLYKNTASYQLKFTSWVLLLIIIFLLATLVAY